MCMCLYLYIYISVYMYSVYDMYISSTIVIQGWGLATWNYQGLRSSSSISTLWKNGIFLRIWIGPMKGGNLKP